MRILSENRRRFDQERAHAFSVFKDSGDAPSLLSTLSSLTDQAVMRQAAAQGLPQTLALVAVGGYGRAEMFPYSDLDILVLVPEHWSEEQRAPVGVFLTSLWDLGLTVGGTERTVRECLEASSDITVATALLESRLIGGSSELYSQMKSEFLERLVPRDFFRDKMLEMHQRHARTGDSPYALEPNVKENPGGLRDLQVFAWIARASGFGDSLYDFSVNGLITTREAEAMRRCLMFLQRLRIEMHLAAGRHEDRLLFDLQNAVARSMGIEGSGDLRPSEMLMKDYYRNAKSVIQLCLIQLQALSDRFAGRSSAPAVPIDEVFQARGEELDLRRRGALDDSLVNILRGFYLRATNPLVQRPSIGLVRELWHAVHNPHARFAADAQSRSVFLSILKLPAGVYRTLRDMNTWGVLSLILPAWSRIEGQMQHDLFHVYTVDQHTIQVIRGLRHLVYAEHAHEFPLLSEIMGELPETWRIIVAALFHDIGKGRGGNHSLLGEADARAFCEACGISREDTEFIAFLVREHLTMSRVAQKQDIADPEVIKAFASVVKNAERLKALYLLTVCDIRATGPKVWNDWKGALLEQLYRATLAQLGGNLPTRSSLLELRKAAALDLARGAGVTTEECEKIWASLDVAYFLRHSAEDIAWHASALSSWTGAGALVRARPAPRLSGIEVLVCAPDRAGLFTTLVGCLQRCRTSVLDARIHTTRDGRALDTFLVMDLGRRPDPQEAAQAIAETVSRALASDKPLPPVKLGPLSRHSRHFPIRPVVLIEPDALGNSWLLSIICNDRPGLLYTISSVLSRSGVNLQTARISTLGERAEDIFQIDGAPLKDPAECLKISREIVESIAPDAAPLPQEGKKPGSFPQPEEPHS
ncbi:[protein-PII] uridylyltransferase [Mesosutterella sp. AGMB02718]|uniref:Bifunctional uridylyltransferase/uridylyl-removing enzyme n=1 Tax=Mesosutterella faecium TaxID=2925194 RepID=A0ABT7IMV6_9BURK|nr:[protein-PII] uridylyltransferase [Mesosutterella sp. AGMB02718]MDL2059709.1 [protein-PII] uridylyltransferase [Mesosutterella sp. AGMB02718]